MNNILELIQKLTKSYEMLTENTDQIFQALKVKDYKRKEKLELETKYLFEQKNFNEQLLISLVKETAEKLGLEEKRIETILSLNSNIEEKMKIDYALKEMLNNINSFRFNLRRNIEFAAAFMEVKGTKLEIMFEVINREQMEHSRPLLINEEV